MKLDSCVERLFQTDAAVCSRPIARMSVVSLVKKAMPWLVLPAALLICVAAGQSATPRFSNEVREYLDRMDSGRALAIFKLRLIENGAKTGNMSAFAHIKPTPSELYREVALTDPGRLKLLEYGKEEALEVRDYLRQRRTGLCNELVSAYRDLLRASPGTVPAKWARAYLGAYLLGTGGEGDPRELLEFVSSRLDEKPLFLAFVAADELDDCMRSFAILDSLEAGGMSAPEEAVTLCEFLLEKSRSRGQFLWQEKALTRLVSYARPQEREKRLLQIIRLYSTEASRLHKSPENADLLAARELFRKAADCCASYVGESPQAKNALTIAYERIVYSFKAASFEDCLSLSRQFRQAHPKANVVPDLLVIEGMCSNALGHDEAALDLFNQVLIEYREKDSAATAAYLCGTIYLTRGDKDKAGDMFRRVVDFYPSSQRAFEAKAELKKIVGRP